MSWDPLKQESSSTSWLGGLIDQIKTAFTPALNTNINIGKVPAHPTGKPPSQAQIQGALSGTTPATKPPSSGTPATGLQTYSWFTPDRIVEHHNSGMPMQTPLGPIGAPQQDIWGPNLLGSPSSSGSPSKSSGSSNVQMGSDGKWWDLSSSFPKSSGGSHGGGGFSGPRLPLPEFGAEGKMPQLQRYNRPEWKQPEPSLSPITPPPAAYQRDTAKYAKLLGREV